MRFRRQSWKRPECGLIDLVSDSTIDGWLVGHISSAPVLILHIGERVVPLKVHLVSRPDVEAQFPGTPVVGFQAQLPTWLGSLRIASPRLKWQGRGWLQCESGVDAASEGFNLDTVRVAGLGFPRLAFAEPAPARFARLSVGTGQIRLDVQSDGTHEWVELPMSLGLIVSEPFSFLASLTEATHENRQIVIEAHQYVNKAFEKSWLGLGTANDLLTAIGYAHGWGISPRQFGQIRVDLASLLAEAAREIGIRTCESCSEEEALLSGVQVLIETLTSTGSKSSGAIQGWLRRWLAFSNERDQILLELETALSSVRQPERSSAGSGIITDNTSTLVSVELACLMNPSDWESDSSILWKFLAETSGLPHPYRGPVILTDWGQQMRREWGKLDTPIIDVPGGQLRVFSPSTPDTVDCEAEIEVAVKSSQALTQLRPLQDRIWSGPHRAVHMPANCIEEWLASYQDPTAGWPNTLAEIAQRNERFIASANSRRTSPDLLFSVVLPVHNRSGTLGRAIESVLAQTHSNLEVLVVDDGSNDGSAEVAKSYAHDRVRVIETSHRGAAAARNTGLDECIGDYVVFCDSDNMMCANFLEALGLSQNKMEWGYTKVLRTGDDGFDELGEPYNEALLLAANYIDQGAIFFPRALLLAGIRFREDTRRSIDLELALALGELLPPRFIDVHAGLITCFTHQTDRLSIIESPHWLEAVWFEWACNRIETRQPGHCRSVVVRLEPSDVEGLRALRSVIVKQERAQTEWVVVGDGSSAEYWATARGLLEDPGVVFAETFSDFPAHVQMALGGATAKGERIAFIISSQLRDLVELFPQDMQSPASTNESSSGTFIWYDRPEVRSFLMPLDLM